MRITREPKPIVTEFTGESKLIKGMFIVDAEYYDWLMQYNWYLGTTGYAVTNISTELTRTKNLKMHRMIMDAPAGILVDHINRDKFDNRVANLRFSDKSKNSLNSNRSDTAKLYTYDKSRNKWMVFRRVKNKNIHYGRFDTEQEAIQKAMEVKRIYKMSEIMPRGDR